MEAIEAGRIFGQLMILVLGVYAGWRFVGKRKDKELEGNSSNISR